MTLKHTMSMKVTRHYYELSISPSQFIVAKEWKKDFAGIPDDAKLVEWDESEDSETLILKFVQEVPVSSGDTERNDE